MELVDLYPSKSYFLPGEAAALVAEISSEEASSAVLLVHFYHLENLLAEVSLPVGLHPGTQQVEIHWQPPAAARRGYGVAASLSDEHGTPFGQASTAFDVLNSWIDFPRCGFLTDFTHERQDAHETIDALVRFHINALQFYDWQYRHHELLPPDENYIDPLGRLLSLRTVRDLLEAAHQRGMRALAYLAVYAAGLDFWREHQEWALHDQNGTPLTFFDFLGLVDPSPGGPWSEHLLAECKRTLEGLPFDGLQVDQYGDPKTGFTSSGAPVNLPGAFAAFMAALRAAHPQAGLLFNAVGNWPIEQVAAAPTDAVYIEIWPPAIQYSQVADIVQNARQLSGGKPVIIALYLPAEQVANNLISDAVILAAGGTRIELGENARLLSDPYFPKHQAISAELYRALRRYASFAVRFGELLGPLAQVDARVTVAAPKDVIAIPRRSQGWLAIPLVNMCGLDNAAWNESHPFPRPLENLQIEILGVEEIASVWWASPDSEPSGLAPASWQRSGSLIRVTLPHLETFSLLALRLASAQNDPLG